MSAYRDGEQGGFDEILHVFADIIKTLHFLGAFAVLYVMMNKIGEDIKQKLKRPDMELTPDIEAKRCPLSIVAQVKTPVRDTFGVCLTDEVRYICDGQHLTAHSDTIRKVATCSCHEHIKHPEPKVEPKPENERMVIRVLRVLVIAPVVITILAIILAILVWLFNLGSLTGWWDEGIGGWISVKENSLRFMFLLTAGFLAWIATLLLLVNEFEKRDKSVASSVKTSCSTLYFVDGTVMKHVTMLTPALDFTTITGVQKLDLKSSETQTASGLTADEMRDLADRLKDVISEHRYAIAHALGAERYNRTVRLLPDLKVFDPKA